MTETVKTFVEALDMILDGGRAYNKEYPDCFIYVEEMHRNYGEGMGQIKGYNLKPTHGAENLLRLTARSYANMIKIENWIVDTKWSIIDGMEIR